MSLCWSIAACILYLHIVFTHSKEVFCDSKLQSLKVYRSSFCNCTRMHFIMELVLNLLKVNNNNAIMINYNSVTCQICKLISFDTIGNCWRNIFGAKIESKNCPYWRIKILCFRFTIPVNDRIVTIRDELNTKFKFMNASVIIIRGVSRLATKIQSSV